MQDCRTSLAAFFIQSESRELSPFECATRMSQHGNQPTAFFPYNLNVLPYGSQSSKSILLAVSTKGAASLGSLETAADDSQLGSLQEIKTDPQSQQPKGSLQSPKQLWSPFTSMKLQVKKGSLPQSMLGSRRMVNEPAYPEHKRRYAYLRRVVCDLLKSKIESDKYFRFEDFTVAKKSESLEDDQELDAISRPDPFASNERDLVHPKTMEEFVSMCKQDRETSYNLQKLIEVCSWEELEVLVSWVKQQLHSLITHQFGNYIVQKILQRDQHFQRYLIHTCADKFQELACNEFGSRVMQTLVHLNDDFRKSSLDHFRLHTNLLGKSISAVFLLSVLVRISDPAEIEFLRVEAVKNPKKWLTNKYYKRVLVSYLQNCKQEGLELFFKGLRIKNRVFDFLEDKYCCYMLLMLIEKNHKEFEEVLLTNLRYELPNLLSTKFFRFFFAKAVRISTPKLLVQISEVLLQLDTQNYLMNVPSTTFFFFTYMLTSTVSQDQLSAFSNYLRKHQSRLPVEQAVDGAQPRAELLVESQRY